MEDVIYTLEWAWVGLYNILANSATRSCPWGRPDADSPIFLGCKANKIQMVQRFEVSEKRPTGSPFPIQRHLSREHVISMERVWVTQPNPGDPLSDSDYQIVPNRIMVLRITWAESGATAPPGAKPDNEVWWMTRTYYGVTAPDFSQSADAESVAFLGEQSMRAMFFRDAREQGVIPLPLPTS